MNPQTFDIASLLDPARAVVLAGVPNKNMVISALADLATTDLPAHDRIGFLTAALEREDVTTTAIGNGFAIPHARTSALARCRIAVGVIPGGVTWGAADGLPVHIALLIAAREADHAEHLRVMANLALRLRRPGLSAQLSALTDPAAVVAALRS